MRMGGFDLRSIGAAVVAAVACAALASSASAQLFVLSPLPSNPFARFHDAYIDPFTDPGWYPARTDQGVDWIPEHKLPVLAIGDAVIIGSSSHAGWPGGRFIYYALLGGSHAGDIVYVAEHLGNLAPAGKYVRAGQQIATAVPGSPYTEWGWATPYGGTVAAPVTATTARRPLPARRWRGS